jgi:hypothetical protein
MARTDIAGLLTGMPSSRPDPLGAGINSEQQRLAFGAQRAEGLQRGMRGLMGGDTMTPAEQLQMAMAQLDLSKPEDLRKLASVQQATGDLAGAAQTAARIQAMKQADIEETRAKARENRAVASELRALETYEIGKIDRLDDKERKKLSDSIAKEQLAMAKAREARQKAASEKALSDEVKLEAQQGELRTLYVNEAIDKGKPELAEKIRIGMDLATAGTLLTKTSTAQIKPVTGDEKDAYDNILYTPAMQKLLPEALKKGWRKVGPISDATENAIFLKTKEIATREQLSTEIAMVKAINALVKLQDVPPDEEGSTEETTEPTTRSSQKNKNNSVPVDETPSPQADDPFGNI